MDFVEFERFAHASGYPIQRAIGRGGIGEVFAALEVKSGKTVALKRLHSTDERMRARFVREARLLLRLDHPNLVNGIAFFESEPIFLVMELVDAPSVSQRASGGDLLSERDAWAILRQAGSALSYMHSESVIHRDIKPANVLYARESEHTWLCDLGIAKDLIATRLTATNEAVGTLMFLAPEVFMGGGDKDEALDAYGLGVTVWSGLAGRPPFVAARTDPYALIRKITNDQAPDLRRLRPEISRKLQEILDALMSKEPSQRPLPADLCSHA